MSKVPFYNRYNPKPINDGTDFTGREEVCNQLAAEECEINRLLHQFESGELSQLPVVRESQYNDVLITPKSYEEAKSLVDSVERDFNTLPKDIQRQFGSLQNYISDLSKIASGDASTLAKYSKFNNFLVSSPSVDGNISVASGVPSSSLSRGDSETVSTGLNSTPVVDFAVEGGVKNGSI